MKIKIILLFLIHNIFTNQNSKSFYGQGTNFEYSYNPEIKSVTSLEDLIVSNSSTLNTQATVNGNFTVNGNLKVINGNSLTIQIGTNSENTNPNSIFLSTPLAQKNEDNTYTAGIYINTQSLPVANFINNADNVILFNQSSGRLLKKQLNAFVQNNMIGLSNINFNINSSNISYIASGDTNTLNTYSGANNCLIEICGVANQVSLGDSRLKQPSSFNTMIFVSGQGNHAGSAVTLPNPAAGEWRQFPSGQLDMVFCCGENNNINYDVDTRPPETTVANINTHSAVIACGLGNTVNNYGSKSNGSEGKASLIICAGQFHKIINSPQNNIIISTGLGESGNNIQTYNAPYGQSIILSANKNGFIILDPRSIPLYNDDILTPNINDNYVLCLKNSKNNQFDSDSDGRISKRLMQELDPATALNFGTSADTNNTITIGTNNNIILNNNNCYLNGNFEIDGNTTFKNLSQSTNINDNIIVIDTLGTIRFKSINDFPLAPSSRKYKENITFFESSHSDFNLLHAIMFNYKKNIKNGRKSLGFIAEDLIGTPFEFAIITDHNGNPETIDYNSLFVYLINLYQTEYTSTQKRLHTLEEQVNSLLSTSKF
jgi:hypothetical protein